MMRYPRLGLVQRRCGVGTLLKESIKLFASTIELDGPSLALFQTCV